MRLHRHRSHAQSLVTRLDERLERIGELREDVDPPRGIARERPETGDGVGDLDSGSLADDPGPDPLEQALGGREVRELARPPIPDDEVGAPVENRQDQGRNVRGVVLHVGVEVDDDVGAHGERLRESRREGLGEPPVRREAQDAVGPGRAGPLRSRVRGAVVDHETLQLGEARDAARQRGERPFDRGLFVERRNLNDELHRLIRFSLERFRTESAPRDCEPP